MDILFGLLFLIFFVLWFRLRKTVNHYKTTYANIVNVDNEILKRQKELDDISKQIDDVKIQYNSHYQTYVSLKERLAIYEEGIEMSEVGVYTPHFDFDTSEIYKENITAIKQKQKDMIKSGEAVKIQTEWEINGSKAKGRVMAKQAISLALRSFNNECDVTIANTTWKNIDRMEQRIKKSFDDINKFNKSNTVSISPKYLSLKLDELMLVYEYKAKIQEEKEIQAELRRQEREEEQLKKEAERALKEEQKLQELLNKVQQKALHATGDELEKLQTEILQLGNELCEIQREHDRVKAMAQQTKLGYVYVISNIGSFGKDVYKIGMTRRLDPMDRVRELGDASVPFYFDVHAMIFSEDAPALEAQIQRVFADRRLNLVNYRKEFFNVTLDEIKKVVSEFNNKVEFIDEVEAKEYTETLRIRNQTLQDGKDDLPKML
ncbi:DUF4041 domain-containing protein [Moraxella nonliquefaciens]|uniref:DUF4041 domain-containing protein n=1 Tax=Moraxella nonliquefaciens TaxID=478 RepID=UPI001EF4D4B0|nr:DUF4041 domain-containing protein [Moraxella nonliquefaciens]MCG7412832.1 DUF4041 domain-containing protein [Moraxella nonliquefaciens]